MLRPDDFRLAAVGPTQRNGVLVAPARVTDVHLSIISAISCCDDDEGPASITGITPDVVNKFLKSSWSFSGIGELVAGVNECDISREKFTCEQSRPEGSVRAHRMEVLTG